MVSIATPSVSSPTTRDFTSFSAYLNAQGLIQYGGEGAQNRTETLKLRPTRQDVGNNANEVRPESGDIFSQADFSHGSGQGFFHKKSSDPAKYLYSEGFDISEVGLLRHLRATILANGGALTAGSSGRSAQAGGKVFFVDGNNVRVYDPITGSASTENPHAGEGAVAVQDLTAEGGRIFAALGANGIHIRSTAGTWTHYSDAQAILVSFLKDRIIATTARDFYEIVASGAAPAAKLTLKEGWTFTDLGENGPYIYAACNDGVSLSKVQIFGLDSTLTLVHQGASWMPENDLCYSFRAQLGIALIGCGRVNDSGGKDPVLYKAIPDDSGFLPIDLVAEGEGAGTRDLAVRAMATDGRNFLVGWTLGASSPYGVREGIAKYDPALKAFSHHLSSSTSTVTPDPVLSITKFEGRVCFATIDGVYYEDTSTYVGTAFIIPSTGHWNTPSLKNWDRSALSYKALPNTASVAFQYTTARPEQNAWVIAGTASTPSSTEATFRHANVESARFTPKIISTATTTRTQAPEIETFSVRSNPTVADTEFRLFRTIQIFERDALSPRGGEVRQNPRTVKTAIEAQYLQWFDWYEADTPNGYNVRLTDYQIVEPEGTIYNESSGEIKDGFIMVLVMEGQKN